MTIDEEIQEFISSEAPLPDGRRGKRPPKEPDPIPPQKALSPRQIKALEKEEVKELAKAMITDPLYLTKLRDRLLSGRIPPAVEVALWNYAFGKPKELKEVKKAVAVRIEHVYADQKEAGELAEEALEGMVLDGTGDGEES